MQIRTKTELSPLLVGVTIELDASEAADLYFDLDDCSHSEVYTTIEATLGDILGHTVPPDADVAPEG